MRKKLLSEAQVRRFQSLASIRPLNEMDSAYSKDDSAYKSHEDDKMEGLYEEEEMEMDADEPEMDEADVEMDEELVQQFMDAVGTIQKVADILGGEAGGEMDMDAEGDMDAMDDAGEEGEEEPIELDAGGEDEGEEGEEEMLQEALRGINYVPSQKEVVKIVAKRVAKRLQEAKRAQAQLNKALGKK